MGAVGPDLLRVSGTIPARYTLVQPPVGQRVAHGVNGNQVGVTAAELRLGSLASNGGPTQAHALLAGSVAIDAGRLSTCMPTDQRGVRRPFGAGCDMGSFEFSQ
jgi:hypothetical protein